jgi:hypothetical protein
MRSQRLPKSPTLTAQNGFEFSVGDPEWKKAETKKRKVIFSCDILELIIKILCYETKNSFKAMVCRYWMAKSFGCCPVGLVVRGCRFR